MSRGKRSIGPDIDMINTSLIIVGDNLNIIIDGATAEVVDLSVLDTLLGLPALVAVRAALLNQPKNVRGLVNALIAKVPK